MICWTVASVSFDAYELMKCKYLFSLQILVLLIKIKTQCVQNNTDSDQINKSCVAQQELHKINLLTVDTLCTLTLKKVDKVAKTQQHWKEIVFIGRCNGGITGFIVTNLSQAKGLFDFVTTIFYV